VIERPGRRRDVPCLGEQGLEHDALRGRVQGVREVVPGHIRPEPQPKPGEEPEKADWLSAASEYCKPSRVLTLVPLALGWSSNTFAAWLPPAPDNPVTRTTELIETPSSPSRFEWPGRAS